MGFFDFVGGQPYPIAAPGKRKLYLISFGGLCELDLPDAIERYQRKQSLIDSLKVEAAIGWMAAESGRTEDMALVRLTEDPTGWDLFLSAERRAEFATAQAELMALDLGYKAMIATVMMRNRLAFHLEVAEAASPGATNIKIVNPWFVGERLIAAGDVFRSLHGGSIAVQDGNTLGDEAALSIQSMGFPIRQGEPLFLVEDGEYVCGAASWTEDHTRKLTRRSGTVNQLDQIVKFFELEQASKKEAADTDTKIPLANGQNNSESTANPPVPTGIESTGDSSRLDVTTPGLPTVDPSLVLQFA